MPFVQVGQTGSISIRTYDNTGALAAVGAMSGLITFPDGTTTTGSVTNPSVGNYTLAATMTQPGRTLFTLTATGVNSGGTPWTDLINVSPVDQRALISLSDARDELNLTAANTSHDDELRTYIAAATLVVEDITGPVLKTTITEAHDGGRPTIVLYSAALVQSVISVVETGVTLVNGSDYVVYPNSAILSRMIGISPYPFRYGVQNVVVTFVVGSNVVAANVILGTRMLVAHWYQTAQQSGRPQWDSGDSEMAYSPSGYAVPRRVIELLQTPNIPGIA